MAAN
ncbi:hypothetical protein CFC21_035211, partial [Triticum aestivum]|jgi:hypothetical protein